MNGPHDLGGQHGLGPIDPEPEAQELVFHAPWERRVFAVTLATGFLGRWNIDESRHARERQHPVSYLRNSYYENWLAGLETLLVEKEIVTADELARGKAAAKAVGYNVPDGAGAIDILSHGHPATMEGNIAPGHALGDRVRVINDHPLTHTRAPRYVRGRVGTIERLHGVHIFADANANGDCRGEHLYSVRFEADELWGTGAGGRDAVYVDLWGPHLEHP